MASIGLLENGPMFDWSRDGNIYKNYKAWKQRALEMVLKSALRTCDEAARCEYLKYWLGKEGLPLIEHWTKTGKVPTVECRLMLGINWKPIGISWRRNVSPRETEFSVSWHYGQPNHTRD